MCKRLVRNKAILLSGLAFYPGGFGFQPFEPGGEILGGFGRERKYFDVGIEGFGVGSDFIDIEIAGVHCLEQVCLVDEQGFGF